MLSSGNTDESFLSPRDVFAVTPGFREVGQKSAPSNYFYFLNPAPQTDEVTALVMPRRRKPPVQARPAGF